MALNDDLDRNDTNDSPPAFGRAEMFPADEEARRPRISWVQVSAMLRIWARETFSLRSFINLAKSMAWVIPLSILIWVYAERELTKTEPENFSIKLKSPDPHIVVRLLEPLDGKLRVDLSGPQGNLQRVKEQISDGGIEPSIEVPDSQLSPGRHTILAGLVANDIHFVRDGVTVTNPVPRELTIFVDQLKTEELDVLPPLNFKNLMNNATFTPQRVKVTAPQTELEEARLSGRLYAYARLEALPGAETPGPHDLRSVPIGLGFSASTIAVDAPSVSAHYEVRKSDASTVIPSMPVWVVWPPGMSEQYKADYEPAIANVRVTGPEEQIRQLQNPDFKPKPKAVFEVSTADLPPDTPHERVLGFELPPDVHVSAEDAARTVRFRLVERKSAE